MIRNQILHSVVGLLFLMGLTNASLFSQTSTPPPPDGSLVTYVAFDGTTYTLREFNGLHVALLIGDAQLAVAGETFVRQQIDRYDQIYDALKDFLGSEPSGTGLLRIAVLPDQGQAGFGIIGGKGCEITHLFFDNPDQPHHDLLYEIVKHEMIHNFDHYSSYFFTAPDPVHSWTDFLQPYAGFYLQEGFTDQSLVAPDDWLRITTDRYFGSYLSFPGHSWATCVQSSACDGGAGGMAQHAQGGVALRVAQRYGPRAMKNWYPAAQQIITTRNLSPGTMSDGDKVDFLFETLSNAVGDNLSCFADSIQWPLSASLRSRLNTLPRSSYCDDQDHDGYSPLQGDFNDNNPTVYPGAPEIVDGLDNDLNGAVDEVLVSENSPFPNQIANALLVPWPVRITGRLTTNTGSNADYWHFFKINVATTVNLRFQLKNTGNFNGYVQIYNPDGSGYSSEYTSSFSEPTDLTLTFTPGEWRFSVIFGASGGPGSYELVVGQALPRVDPLLFAGSPINEPSGPIRFSVPKVSPQLIPRSTEVRFWVSGFGWVGSSPVPGSGSPFFDWTPPSGVDLSGLRYTIQYFKDGLRSSAASPGVPLLTAGCSFTIEPTPINVPAGGGSAKLAVTTSVGCPWQVAADSPWIALSGDTGPIGNNNGTGPPLGWGRGDGSINVYVDANTSSQVRTATLTIAGQTISVNQSASAIGLSASQVQFSWRPGSPAPAAQSVIVSNGAPGTLTWSATASLPWIVVSPRSGSAPAFAVSVDTGANQVQMPGTYSGNVTIAAAGGSITNVSVMLTVLVPVTATMVSKVGVFRGGFFWLLDQDGNQQFNSPPDRAFAFGGIPGDIPITGDWNGSGTTKVGVYRSSNGLFILDYDGDGQFTAADKVYNLGVGTQAGDLPVVGDWNGDGRTKIGLFRQGFFWILDTNGNGVFDAGDQAFAYGGVPGDVPIIGDWNGTGVSKVGVFRAGFLWILDTNNSHAIDSGDQIFPFGGIAGDVPVVGDWNGDGRTKVGVFRMGFFWVLDANGNFQFDGTGPGQDLAFAFGGISGDKPVIGKW